MRWLSSLWVLVVCGWLLACSDAGGTADSSLRSKAEPISTTSITQSADELRTAWYPNQPQLSPSVVSGATFGKLFSTPVSGAVYAEPLVSAGTLFVATESNNIYGLDPETGAVRWTRNVGTPFASTDIGCGDLAPSIGITGTPVVDVPTNVAYFFAKRYTTGSAGAVTIEAHAVDVATGIEKTGFPVSISGAASNDPTHVFTTRSLHQRPGLLLLNGVVYAAFGAHCDIAPWAGWVVGVSTSGLVTTLWSDQSGSNRTDGAGIWQSGSALVSDGDGQILFATGNGGSPIGPIAGHSPPQSLSESIVRVGVQPDGTLSATDFFAPYDAVTLDTWDADFAASGPVGLPSPYFGTLQYPHLLVATGKQGYVYLLNRDNLGGIANGPAGGDAVLARVGPYGGVWSKAAVWPGDGGYLYIPTASGGNSAGGSYGNLRVFKYGVDGTGSPTLSLVGTSTDAFGFSSSSPVVTSDQTQSGTALVWTIWAPDGSGSGAQLRAYDPVPVAGAPVLRFSAPIGQSAKFVPPGVGDGRIYVGTRDGQVLGFGAPMSAPLRGTGLDLGSVVLGGSSQSSVVVTANSAVTVNGITSTNADFAISAGTPALPATLAANATLQIPVTFTPSVVGLRAGAMTLQTSAGPFLLAVSGQGQSATPQLVATPTQVSFGGVASGAQVASSVTFTNTGGAALTINRVIPPDAPFGVGGAPAPGATLASGAAVTLTVSFSPMGLGTYMGSIALDTSAGLVDVPMSGVCAPAGHLTISPLAVAFTAAGVGSSSVGSFTVSNTGGSSLRITRSKPPASGIFNALTALPEGTTLLPGDALTEYVSFIPTAGGSYSDTWSLNGDDGGGVQNVALTGMVLTDLTPSATIIALITNPAGGGSKNLEVIRDGVTPAVGSTNWALQYDTYNGGGARAEDWIGYQFTQPLSFSQVMFQEGGQFADGGWFTSLNVQVRQNGTWVTVPNVVTTPAYPGANGIDFETFTFTFPAIVGDGIRIDGAPGGNAKFISVGELRVFGQVLPHVNGAPTANAGAAQEVVTGATVTLDGSASSDPDGDVITYAWTQTAGPTVALSSPTAQRPTFVTPTVTSSTALTFSLVVNDGSLSSSAASVTVTVDPTPPPPPPGGTDITSSATIIALITKPTGGGSKSLEVIRDGVTPAVGSSNWALQYDTYNGGGARAEDWIGYTFTTSKSFTKVVFQEGGEFNNGGWFTSLKIQVRQSGTWVTAPSVTVTPTYPGAANGVDFETYTFTLPAVIGDAIRIDGAPGGSAKFISVGELRVFAL